MVASNQAFWAAAVLAAAPSALALVNYPIEFTEPKAILDRTYNNVTIDAQQSIIKWADSLDVKGPWGALLHDQPLVCLD